MAKGKTAPTGAHAAAKGTTTPAGVRAAAKEKKIPTEARIGGKEQTAATEEQHSILDDQFAQLMMTLAAEPSAVLERSARRVSQATRERNVCIDIEPAHLDALAASGVVGTPDAPERPMVLDAQGRLYLNRYWQYQRTVAEKVLERVHGRAASAGTVGEAASAGEAVGDADGGALSAAAAPVREGNIEARLDEYFPGADAAKNRLQRDAALHALQQNMCIISGGPGTGKTTTVAVILALLVEFSGKADLHIALAAPTGKAAARLQESIVRQKGRLPIPALVKEKIPETAGTMHRLLRPKRGTPYFRHDRGHPLAADVIVLDECSMIDAALMAKFMDAVGPQTRLIFLGDKDQLSSVEAGAVFSDLCSADLPCVDQLTYSHRFTEASGIGALSRAVNAGDFDAAMGVLGGGFGDIAVKTFPTPQEYDAALEAAIIGGYREYFGAKTVEEAFARLNYFRILCAVREGPYGVNGINRVAEDVLKHERIIEKRTDSWYRGCPVMITENEYGLSLFNGDVGIVWPDDAQDGALAVYFEGTDAVLRKFHPSSLPSHELVYAMTVHKSQGSQFGRVLTILPPEESPVVTRELLYTAITRAEDEAHLWASEAVVRRAVTNRTVRHSGLREALQAGL